MLKVKTRTTHHVDTTFNLFQKVSKLADELEDLIEDGANYRSDFLKGLQTSMKQAKAGRVKKLRSLSEM